MGDNAAALRRDHSRARDNAAALRRDHSRARDNAAALRRIVGTPGTATKDTRGTNPQRVQPQRAAAKDKVLFYRGDRVRRLPFMVWEHPDTPKSQVGSRRRIAEFCHGRDTPVTRAIREIDTRETE